MLSLFPEKGDPRAAVPPAFEGRANTELSTLTVSQAKRYLKVQKKAFLRFSRPLV